MLGAGLLRAKRAASPAARGLFEHRVGAGTLPARGSGTAGLKLRRGRGGGLTLRPSPAMPPSPPSGLRRLRLLQRGPCATGPVIGSAGPRSRQGLQRSADGRAGLGAGVPAGWGAGVAAAACALLLLRPPRVARWTLIPADWQRVREGIYPPPASWPDTLTNKHREVVP